MISHKELKEILDYDPKSGVFRWKKRISVKSEIGKIAGYNPEFGYCQIRIFTKLYSSHSLAWLYVTGEWQKGEIDHKNRNPSDNSFSNLRDVSRSENNSNHNRRVDNSTGFRGVSYSQRDKTFHAYINKNGARTNIGYFKTAEEAALAYDSKAIEFYGECAYQNFGVENRVC